MVYLFLDLLLFHFFFRFQTIYDLHLSTIYIVLTMFFHPYSSSRIRTHVLGFKAQDAWPLHYRTMRYKGVEPLYEDWKSPMLPLTSITRKSKVDINFHIMSFCVNEISTRTSIYTTCYAVWRTRTSAMFPLPPLSERVPYHSVNTANCVNMDVS